MMKTAISDGSHILSPNPGYELVVISDGVEIARVKEVIIPVEGTLNEWVEVPEKPPEPVPALPEETAEQKIARLEAEIAALKSGK